MKLKGFFDFVEAHLSPGVKLVIGATIVVALVHAFTAKPPNDITTGSVMITNSNEKHGGTGVILKSSSTESTVLTNSHVCKVIEHGGVVHSRVGKFMVQTYKHSNIHDMCLLTVNGNLGYSTSVAKASPVSYYEKALISGHPNLLPNVVTSGHFSGRKIIQVMTGFKQCTEEDAKNPATGLLCLLIGAIPQVAQFESILVTATIMPGSSGSGVYNENKELVGLAFAGSGELGYAWTVPFEALKQFLGREQYELTAVRVPKEMNLTGDDRSAKSDFDYSKVLKTVCKTMERTKVETYCPLVEQDLLWSE